MEKLVYKELSYEICGLLFKVHNELGRFKNEKQYSDYFEQLLKDSRMRYVRECRIDKAFPGEKDARNICDFIIEDKIIVEFKVKNFLSKDDYFQVRRYLSCTGLKLAIIVNFRQKYITPKRVLNNEVQ